jgi:hypothetical protein
VNNVEDRVYAAMAAAADLAADEIRTAPPLRLPSESRARSRRQGPPRRWIRWAAPLTAAGVVAALAVALVIIKDLPNGGVVPAGPSTSAAGPGGIPRYYVTIDAGTGQRGAPNTLLVGDSLTGKTIATIPSPAHSPFQGVTAAADDRTFVVYDVTESATSAGTGSWFKLHLAPGTANPADLTPLPIKPVPTPDNKLVPQYGVFSMALSGSAQELAVGEVPSAAGGVDVKVFSLATGQLLHDWSTNDPSIAVSFDWLISLSRPPALSWIDGDQALALTTMSNEASDNKLETVRTLNVNAPNGDLRTASRAIWTTPTADQSGALTCGILKLSRMSPMVSADGKTVSCATVSQPGGTPPGGNKSPLDWAVTFSTYDLAAGTTAARQGTIAYQVTRQEPGPAGSSGGGGLVWVSPSGGTLIGAWGIGAGTSASDVPLYVGVISKGKFTPLRLPAGFTWSDLAYMAW